MISLRLSERSVVHRHPSWLNDPGAGLAGLEPTPPAPKTGVLSRYTTPAQRKAAGPAGRRAAVLAPSIPATAGNVKGCGGTSCPAGAIRYAPAG